MRSLKTFLLLALVAAFAPRLAAQTWVVPDDQKAVTAPFKFTPEMQKQGEQAYMKNCQSCHGLPGKDNWVKLVPPPGDLARDKAQKQTDGEIFYRITAGKAPMPEFRNIIPEDERWHIIAFLRSFNPKYVQPEPATKAAFTGRTIALAMKYDEPSRRIIISATEKLKEGTGPAAGVEVMLYVRRYFGNMPLGEVKTTNSAGEARIEFPPDLPGAKDGSVDLIAMVNDPKGLMRSAPATATLAIGQPNDKPGLTETRAWWSTRDKAPIWLILTFTLSVVIVWGFIFQILYSILKIRRA